MASKAVWDRFLIFFDAELISLLILEESKDPPALDGGRVDGKSSFDLEDDIFLS